MSSPLENLPLDILHLIIDRLHYDTLTTLLRTSRTFRNLLTHTSPHLRRRLFLPTPPPPNPTHVTLHPIFPILHLTKQLRTFGQLLDTPLSSHPGLLEQSATCPAVKELQLELMMFHDPLIIRNARGITLADVLHGVNSYLCVSTERTFEDFLGAVVCRRMVTAGDMTEAAVERLMTRAEMVGDMRVFVRWGAVECKDGVARVRGERFFEVEAVRLGEVRGFPFWGVWARRRSRFKEGDGRRLLKSPKYLRTRGGGSVLLTGK